ncbi:hypothetical protein HYV84_00845 [Candidatus Woesearchaeota archaeon]|nr:hypothetical protein [Candidatus Woesearchaeota archaeon]
MLSRKYFPTVDSSKWVHTQQLAAVGIYYFFNALNSQKKNYWKQYGERIKD